MCSIPKVLIRLAYTVISSLWAPAGTSPRSASDGDRETFPIRFPSRLTVTQGAANRPSRSLIRPPPWMVYR